jgi:GMP reductase
MNIINDTFLDYDDVLLLPKRSSVNSRKAAKIVVTYDFKWGQKFYIGCPITAANMVGVGTIEVAKAMEDLNMLVFLTRQERDKFYTADNTEVPPKNAVPTFGISDDEFSKLKFLLEEYCYYPAYICIDVANGYTDAFLEFIKRVREELNYEGVLIAGNVVTPERTQELILSGVDIVKIGIGPGSNCTTRIMSGIGVPQLSAVMQCAEAAKQVGGHIIADGGIKNPGDAVKAFAAGASFIMLGGYLAGHDESGQEIIDVDGKKYVEFYGNSSHKAQSISGEIKSYRTSEGRHTRIPYKGPIQNTLDELLGGIRSGMTYTGSKSLKELYKRATFIRVNNQYNKNMEKYTIGR